MSKSANDIVRFGQFRLNRSERVLSFQGEEITLEPKAFDVLTFFTAHPGDLLNREQIKMGVWGTTHLEDNNVDQKIAAIRRALSQHDSGREYILNRRGYGWKFGIAVVEDPETGELPEPAPCSAQVMVEPPPPANRYWNVAGAAGITSLVIAIAALLMFGAQRRIAYPYPRQIDYRRLTTDGRPKDGPLVTDGRFVYFSERTIGAEDRPISMAGVSVDGGPVFTPRIPIPPPVRLFAVARDTRDMLYSRWQTEADAGLLVWREKGRRLEQVPRIRADARISPDGTSIAYATQYGQHSLTIRDLSARPNVRRISVVGVPNSPSWSPDGTRLRFAITDPVSETSAFWEVRRDGGHLQRLPWATKPHSYFQEGCWTLDGRYFIYSEISEAASNLWHDAMTGCGPSC